MRQHRDDKTEENTNFMQVPVDTALVLIVDDNLKNVQVIGGLLRGAGYRLNVAQSGEEALNSVARVIPDLIVLDVMMPGIDGFETCRRLQESEETRAIPVLFLTALTDEQDIMRAFEAGAVDYVAKPFRAGELLARVETHASMSQLRRERDRNLDDLNRAFDHIERLHREQDAYLRHELNNAIGPILGYADMLLGQMTVDPARQRKWLAKIRQGATSMRDILTQLKQLQEFERGSAALNTRRMDLVSELTEICSELQVAFPTLSALDLSVNVERAIIDGDPTLLPGVFRNLIKNAVEHVADMESEDDRVVLVRLGQLNGSWEVTIHNSGPPIPPERLKTFFDKFNSTKAGGTGLGTSYARLLTEAHGGRVLVESTEADGTTLMVQLPAAVDAEPPDADAEPEPEVAGA